MYLKCGLILNNHDKLTGIAVGKKLNVPLVKKAEAAHLHWLNRKIELEGPKPASISEFQCI